MSNKIDLCVIVATFNSAKTLAKCLDSIVNQTVRPELIIIDGGSSDGTIEIIKAYQDHIDYWVSEPDAGVYDAWNKAIARATSQWLMFLGSDDRLGSQVDSLVCKLANISDEVDLIYGTIIRDFGDRLEDLGENRSLLEEYVLNCNRMPFTHVGSIHRANSFDKVGFFDSALKIAGDFDFFCRLRRVKKVAYMAEHRLLMGMNGLSQSVKFRTKLLAEIMLIRRRYGLSGCVSGSYIYVKYIIYCLMLQISSLR